MSVWGWRRCCSVFELMVDETEKVTELVEVVDEPESSDSEFAEAPTQPIRIFELVEEDQGAKKKPRITSAGNRS